MMYNPITGRTNGITPNFFATMTIRPPKIVDRPHRHSSAAINYYFHGTGRSTVEGKVFQWKAGDLMLSAPGWAVHNHASYDDYVYELTVQDQPLRGLSILLVEDADDMREAMRVMLEELGARVVGAGNGEEALARLRPGETDVVLCDLRMPQMDGYEFVSLVRKDPARAHVPVVAVSGFASSESYRQSREAGFDGYVTKPFEYATLVASLQQAMATRQRTQEGPRALHSA